MRDKHDGRIEKTKTGKYKCTIRIKYGGKLRYISSTQDTAAKAKKAAQEKTDLKLSDLIGSMTLNDCNLNIANIWDITYYAFHD